MDRIVGKHIQKIIVWNYCISLLCIYVYVLNFIQINISGLVTLYFVSIIHHHLYVPEKYFVTKSSKEDAGEGWFKFLSLITLKL